MNRAEDRAPQTGERHFNENTVQKKTVSPDEDWGTVQKGSGGWQNFSQPEDMRGRGRTRDGILR